MTASLKLCSLAALWFVRTERDCHPAFAAAGIGGSFPKLGQLSATGAANPQKNGVSIYLILSLFPDQSDENNQILDREQSKTRNFYLLMELKSGGYLEPIIVQLMGRGNRIRTRDSLRYLSPLSPPASFYYPALASRVNLVGPD